MVGGDTEATVMLNVVPGMNTGITAFNAGLSSINAQFQNVTDTIGSTFGIMDAMLVSSGAMIAQFGMGAANAFGEFEQGMQIVKAVSQQSGQAIAFLKQEAQDFAIQYRTGIDSITEGLQTLGRAGLNSAQEQTEVLEQGLQTAKLEGRELNGVLEEIIQNTSLLGGDVRSDQFGEQAEYLNNLLVGTSLSAPLDTHDISETLKYSGGMVAAAGGTIATDEGYADEAGREIVEDYMGAVAAFAQKGVKGSIAGTALRAFFNKPASQDESVVEALNTIGLAPEDLWNDEETMKPVSEQIEIIQTQMAAHNVSKMDQMQLWSKIVGGKMGQQMMKLDAQDIREMTTDIQDAKSARELSEQTFNTYNQQMNKFSEEGQKAFREFGSHIVTAIRPALEVLTRLMDLLSNPAISFGGFVAFMTVLSHMFQAVTRIASRLKGEIGWLFGGGQSSLAPSKYKILSAQGISIPTKWDNWESEETKRRRNILKSKYQGKDNISTYLQDDDSWDFEKRRSEKNKQKKQSYFTNVQQDISSINQQMNEMISNMENKLDNLDVSVDINLDEIGVDINNLGTNIKKIIDEINTKAKKTANDIKSDIAEINAEINGISVDAFGVSRTGQPLKNPDNGKLVEFQDKDIVQILNDQYKKPELQNILEKSGVKYRKNDTKSVLSQMIIDNNLLSETNISDFVPLRIFNGNKASINSGIINSMKNDPAFNIHSDNDSFTTYWDDDEMIDLINALHGDPFGHDIKYANQVTEGVLGVFPHALDPNDVEGIRQYMEEAHAREQAINLVNSYFRQLQIIQNEALMEAQASKAYTSQYGHNIPRDVLETEVYDTPANSYIDYINKQNEKRKIEGLSKLGSTNIPGVGIPKEAWDIADDLYYNITPPQSYIDYVNMVKHEGRMKRGRETLGFSSVIPGIGTSGVDLTQEILDKYAHPMDAYTTNYYHYLNERQQRGRETLGFSSVVPGTGVAGVNLSQDILDEYSHSKTWAQRLRDNNYGGRTGKGLSFLGDKANKLGDRFNGLAKSLGSKATSNIGKAVDILGGKFNVALMGATAAMELYNYAFGQWQKSVQEHQTKLSEAQDAVSEAEGNIREEYLANNPDASKEDADKAVMDAYNEIGETGNMSELDRNTQALYVATNQVQRASQLLEADAMDGNFGMGGFFTRLGDDLPALLDFVTGNYGTNLIMDTGEASSIFDNSGVSVSKGGISDNNGEAVLKSSQASEDYIYSKENAAIFAADVWDALDRDVDVLGSYGVGAYFGTDSAHFQEVNRSIFGGSTGFGNSYYTNVIDMLSNNFQSPTDQHQLQMALKNNKSDLQKLGKDIRKFEKANKGRSPSSFFQDKKGGRVPKDKALKNLEVKDKELTRYLKSLSIKTGLSEQKLLMAAQLQQMQDLNQIMNEQVQPQVLGLAQTAYQQLSAQHGIGNSTSNTSSGAWSTYSAAAAIASKLNVLVEQALDTEMQQDYINAGGDNPEYIDNPQKMKADMIKAYNTPAEQRTEQQKNLVDYYGKNWLDSYYLSGWRSAHPNATQEEEDKALANYERNVAKYKDFAGAVGATRQGANAYYTQALLAAYDASSIGEGEQSPSGGSGGGGDGGDKDKDSGTKKERVDLVLCNKKEIPKLNVNLFKKAPQFTVLNKNFKLRDIKINTQDKPKAVLDSLKNAIIDTQKRMDPKIIQDEEAEYDPVAATDGNKTPSGSTSTTTDD